MADQPEGTSPAQAAALVAAARSTRLTGRAAVLAVVICAIALSLAYPVREYIAQRQQIDQLLAQQQTTAAQVKALEEQNAKLGQAWYIEQQARDQLHMCFPQERCYEVISGQPAPSATARSAASADPWYAKLWGSVQRADAASGQMIIGRVPKSSPHSSAVPRAACGRSCTAAHAGCPTWWRRRLGCPTALRSRPCTTSPARAPLER